MNEPMYLYLLLKMGGFFIAMSQFTKRVFFLLHPHKKLERHMYYAINWNDSIPNFDLSFLFVRVGGSGSKKNKHELYWGTEKNKTHGIYKYYQFAGYIGGHRFTEGSSKQPTCRCRFPSIGTNMLVISHRKGKGKSSSSQKMIFLVFLGRVCVTVGKKGITTVDSSMIPGNHLGCNFKTLKMMG